MASEYLIRIMLALLTAVWSPSWCCCSQRAMSPEAGGAASCHSVASSPVSQAPAHCHTPDKASGHSHDVPTPTRHAACACSSTPAEKPAAPAATVSNAAFEFVLADVAPPIFVPALANAPRRLTLQHAPPSADSLLRLHCALIV